MQYKGIWGTIRDDSWDLNDANVVCHQLGYNGALAAFRNAAFGQGTGQIWLDDVQCVGNETLISHCNHLGWGVHDIYCRSIDDAGVVCRPSGKRMIMVNTTYQTSFIVFFLLNRRGSATRKLRFFLLLWCGQGANRRSLNRIPPPTSLPIFFNCSFRVMCRHHLQ